jgi:hypothetical protein
MGELKMAIPAEMGRVAVVLYVVAMVAAIVGVNFVFFSKSILGTADSECWHCLGVRSFLLEIPQASMNKARFPRTKRRLVRFTGNEASNMWAGSCVGAIVARDAFD